MDAFAKKLKEGWDKKARPVRTLCDGGVYKWLVNGQPHREDGPAIEYKNGSTEWRLYGELHREDGPAVDHSGGYQAWYIHGRRHRVDGPAILQLDGARCWFFDDKLHREGGPAVEHADGSVEYWNMNVLGSCFTEEEVAEYNEACVENEAFDRRRTEKVAEAMTRGVGAPLNVRRPLRLKAAG